MALDPYRRCPCGSGKKVKFCCSKDILSDLEKLFRTLEGEQRVAGLDQVNKLIETKGPRPALLVLKANLQIELKSLDEAEKTIEQLFKAVPHNPAALGLKAAMEAHRDEPESAVEKLQEAIEHSEEEMSQSVYAAIGAVGGRLLISGSLLGARGHFLLQATLAGDRDQAPWVLLMRMNADPHTPPLLKEDHLFSDAPADARWLGEFRAAMKSAQRGAWLAACESLSSLSEKVPNQPAILRNIAILRGWLGQEDEAVEAWHGYARLPDVPLEDAVEAETLALLLDEQATDFVRQVKLTYPVQDTDRLMERLLSDRRAGRMPIDLQELAEENQPPPRGAFYLLDRPLPETGADLSRDAVPEVLGAIFVFGRETDREARLEFVSDGDGNVAARKAALTELAGEWSGEMQKEEVAGEVPVLDALLARQWYLPEDTPKERRLALMAEQEREILLQRWTEIPLSSLGGRSPREAARDPADRVRVLAAIALLETFTRTRLPRFDFNELRTELGLPSFGPLDPAEHDVRGLPLVRMARVDVSKLSDSALLDGFRRLVLKNHRLGLQRFAREILARRAFVEEITAEQIYDVLIHSSSTSDDALRYAIEAQEAAQRDRKSPAHWLLAELSIRIGRMESEEANRLLQTLRSRHLREPGVAQQLREILVAYGILTPDGQPASRRPSEPAAPAAAAPAEDVKKIWTPGESGPRAETGSPPSKLWVPGGD